jgi:hypothetical protein
VALSFLTLNTEENLINGSMEIMIGEGAAEIESPELIGDRLTFTAT